MSFMRHEDTLRTDRGMRAFQSGLSAENAVERHYLDRGHETVARRWRRRGVGELDLVMRKGEALVFVEVKKSRDFARAAERLTPQQIARLFDGAAAFLAGEPQGQMTECRFDVALVNASGEIHILENALAA